MRFTMACPNQNAWGCILSADQDEILMKNSNFGYKKEINIHIKNAMGLLLLLLFSFEIEKIARAWSSQSTEGIKTEY